MSEFQTVEQMRAEIERLRNDPNAVHVNLLGGKIAKPSIAQITHIYAANLIEAQAAEIERLRAAAERLLIAMDDF